MLGVRIAWIKDYLMKVWMDCIDS